jgi:superfamily II DNA/RNA helicase
LDRAVDGLVRQFLHDPVTHEADSPQSPVTRMTHHVLHVEREHRLAVLVDLASAPGRTVVFTRTKHGAKALARQLNRSGVPSVELHGNLGQGARTRNLEAFHSGRAGALVATDIAARGIHVDDVALVVHADPPTEHKAYLHRSGRTARAGNAGTVVTLMTSEQVRDVRDLTRSAGISATTTRIQGSSHPVLAELAPGERVLEESAASPVAAPPAAASASASRSSRGGSGRNRSGRNRRRRSGSGQAPAASTGAAQPAKASAPSSRRRRPATPSSGGKRGASAPSKHSQSSKHSAATFSAGRR